MGKIFHQMDQDGLLTASSGEPFWMDQDGRLTELSAISGILPDSDEIVRFLTAKIFSQSSFLVLLDEIRPVVTASIGFHKYVLKTSLFPSLYCFHA